MSPFLEDRLAANPDPTQYSAKEYTQELQRFQAFLRLFITERLAIHSIFDRVQHEAGISVLPIAVGSDARFEKPLLRTLVNGTAGGEKLLEVSALLDLSPVEITLVTQDEIDPDTQVAVERACAEFSNSFKKVVDKEITVVSTQQKSVSAFVDHHGTPHFHISRVFDASAIIPEVESDHRTAFTHPIVAALREKMYEELTGSDGKKIIEFQKELVRMHRQVTATGEQKGKNGTLRHFDRNSGELFFRQHDSGGRGQVGSFKYGPLRLVQAFMVRDLCRELSQQGSRREIATQLPNVTAEKLQFLCHELGLSQSLVGELNDLYEYFLHTYCMSQFNAARGVSTVTVDAKQMSENLQSLLQLLNMEKNAQGSRTPFGQLK